MKGDDDGQLAGGDGGGRERCFGQTLAETTESHPSM
jgi:hypothetical protein